MTGPATSASVVHLENREFSELVEAPHPVSSTHQCVLCFRSSWTFQRVPEKRREQDRHERGQSIGEENYSFEGLSAAKPRSEIRATRSRGDSVSPTSPDVAVKRNRCRAKKGCSPLGDRWILTD